MKQLDSAPNSRRKLDIAIDRLGMETKGGMQLRTMIANTIVGQMLPDGVIKGGSSLKFRFGDKTTRFTKDLDTARVEELDVYLAKLDVALKAGWNGFTGRVIRKDPPKPIDVPGEYIMQPFEIKMDYLSKSWTTVPLEIGHDEIGDTASPDYYISKDIESVFVFLGFPSPKPVALLPIHHQIAQKLHALSTEGSERAHDLIDLQLIEQNENINFALTKESCVRLFSSRKMQNWPPIVSEGANWKSLYATRLGDFDILKTVSEAVDWVNKFIAKIVKEEDNTLT